MTIVMSNNYDYNNDHKNDYFLQTNYIRQHKLNDAAMWFEARAIMTTASLSRGR